MCPGASESELAARLKSVEIASSGVVGGRSGVVRSVSAFQRSADGVTPALASPMATVAKPARISRICGSLARAPIKTVLVAPVRTAKDPRASVADTSPLYQITVEADGLCA